MLKTIPALSILLALTALGVTLTVAQQPVGQLAFVTDRDGNAEVYVVNADGTGLKRLTQAPGDDLEPVWAPDGKALAFTSDRDGNQEIYLMVADGSGQKNITRNPAADCYPCWAPDGTRLAFASDRVDDSEVFACNRDGSGVTAISRSPAWDSLPQWSPAGDLIAFLTDRDQNQEIMVCRADGSGTANVTRHEAWDGDPRFSPDGRMLLFRSHRDGNINLYVAELAMARLWNLSQNQVWNEEGDWSPDGKKVIGAATLGDPDTASFNRIGSNSPHYSLTEPSKTPLRKKRCANGYMTIIGIEARTIAASSSVLVVTNPLPPAFANNSATAVLEPCAMLAICSTAELDCINFRIRYCKVCKSLDCVK